jgi:hypothetical protein
MSTLHMYDEAPITQVIDMICVICINVSKKSSLYSSAIQFQRI